MQKSEAINMRMRKLIENCKYKNSPERGYVAISIVLILSAIILGIIVTVAQLSIGEGQVALSLSKGEDTLDFVEGCMEDALLNINASSSYSGGTITRPEGTCSITVSKSGSTYTTTATTTATTYNRTIQTVLTRSSGISITSWKEQ